MKRVFTTIILSFLTILAMGQKSKDSNLDVELDIKANEIVKYLNLKENKVYEVYKVLYHVKTRQDDVKLGHPKYKQIMSYINQERLDLMLIMLQDKQLLKKYADKYNPIEDAHIASLIAKSNSNVNSYKAPVVDDSEFLKAEVDDSAEDTDSE